MAIRLEKTEGVYGPTIQGEGTNIGIPVTFVRMYGCDFRCNWCDTPFSLGHDKGGAYDLVDGETIYNRVKAIGIPDVVISGGNPLAQGKNLDPMFECFFNDEFFDLQVETQGSIAPTHMALTAVRFWSLSPKLPSAGKMESENWKCVDEIIDQACTYSSAVQLKFVVADRQDYDFLKHRLASLTEDTAWYPVIIQPEGQQLADEPFNYQLYNSRMQRLLDWTMEDKDFWNKYDLRILPQLHKLIWQKERKR